MTLSTLESREQVRLACDRQTITRRPLRLRVHQHPSQAGGWQIRHPTKRSEGLDEDHSPAYCANGVCIPAVAAIDPVAAMFMSICTAFGTSPGSIADEGGSSLVAASTVGRRDKGLNARCIEEDGEA
jgi:hypothetical protein